MRIPQKLSALATPNWPVARVLSLALALFCLSAMQPVSAQNFFVNNDLDISQLPGNETDPAVAVNPNSSTNIFVVGVSSATTNGGLFTSYTTNLNITNSSFIVTNVNSTNWTTWVTNIIASGTNTNNLIPASGQPSVTWDANSNLFLTYVPTNNQGIAVAVSTNSGQTFFPLAYLATNDDAIQPRITAGPPLAGAATNSVWLVYKDNSLDPPSLVAQSLQTLYVGTNVASPIPGAGTNVTDLIGAQSIALAVLGTNVATITNNQLVIGTNTNAAITLATNTLIVAENTTNLSTNAFNTNSGFTTTITPTIGAFADGVLTNEASGSNTVLKTTISFQSGTATFPSGTNNVQIPLGNSILITNTGAITLITNNFGTNGVNGTPIVNNHGVITNQIAGGTPAGSATFAYINFNGTTNTTNLVSIDTNQGVWTVISNILVTNAGVSTNTNIVVTTFSNCITNYAVLTRGISPFSSQEVIPGSSSGGFPDVATGPSNQVMVAYQNNIFSSGTSSVFVSVNANTLLTNGFGPAVTVANNAVGGFTYIPAEETADGINAGVGVAWDQDLTSPYYGRAYLAYTSVGAGGVPSMNISSCYSTNNGAKWSAASQVNDDNDTYSHFFPRIAVDQVTGSVALCWYDCRNDTGDYPNDNPVITVITSGKNPSTNTYTNVFDLDGTANNDFMVYGATSLMGGADFPTPNLPAIPIWTLASLTANPPSCTSFSYVSEASQANNGNGLGHHIGLAYSSGNIYPIWADNSTYLPVCGPSSNPDASPLTNFDFYTGFSQLPTANLEVLVTYSPTNPISDESLTYYIVVTNLGPFAATNIIVTNVLSTNVNLTGVNAAPGEQVTITGNGQLLVFKYANPKTVLAVGQSITNSIIVTAVQAGVATNVASAVSLIPNPVPIHGIVTNTVTIGAEDLALGMSASPTNVDIGNLVTFTLIVTNLGPAANGLVFITNVLSSDLSQITNVIQSQGTYSISNNILVFSLGTLASNQIVTNYFSAVALSLGTKHQLATNTAFVTSSDFDTSLSNNYATNVITILGEDVGVGLSAFPTNVNIGDTITYTLDITNFGASVSGNIVFTNTLSDNVTNLTIQSYSSFGATGTVTQGANIIIFDADELGDDQVFSMTYTAVARSVSATDTNVLSFVSVSSTDFDTNLVNNTAGTIVTINGEDLAIGVTATPNPVWDGQSITYTDSVTNFGPSTNGVINVTNTLSTNLTVLPDPSYIINGNQVIFQVGTLNAGDTVDLTFTATTTGIGTATDLATVGSDDFETNLLDNTNLVATTVIVPPPPFGNFSVTAFASSAFIDWTTPVPARVQVAYGLTTNYGNITTLSPCCTNHVVMLTGLTRNTTNYFCAMAWEEGILYQTNGSFFTTNSVILKTGDAFYTGTWSEGSPSLPGIYGSYFNVADTTASTIQSNATASATYTPSIPTPGLYSVYTWYPSNVNFSTNTQMYVSGVTNTIIKSVNQTANGGSWQLLSPGVSFAEGTGNGTNDNTIIYNSTGEVNKLVAANAMMWTYGSNQDYTAGAIPTWWSTWWSNYLGTNIAATTSNYDAYVFGLPPDWTKNLKFQVSFPDSNTIMACFSPVQGGRTYQLQISTNLADSQSWSNLTLTPPSISTNAFDIYSNGTGDGIFITNFPNTTQTFFRLAVGLSTNY